MHDFVVWGFVVQELAWRVTARTFVTLMKARKLALEADRTDENAQNHWNYLILSNVPEK